MIDRLCIFRNNLLNIWTTTYDFWLLHAYLITWSRHKRSHAKSELTRNKALAVKFYNSRVPTNNVEIKNIKLAGYAGCT